LSESKTLLNELFDSVVMGNAQKARKLAERAMSKRVPANIALDKMVQGMREVDKKYERKEYFTVDVAAASTAMREALKVLEPYMKVESANVTGKVAIGSLKGNIQGLGKDIVAGALRSAGFEVVDLGVNVAPEAFVEAAVREKAQVVAVSVSIDETVPYLKDIVDILGKRQLTGKIKTIVGGRAVDEKKRRQYHIDAYASDAWECVKKVRELLSHS